jgi:hypothetical protein
MKRALTIGLAALFLAGCGGSASTVPSGTKTGASVRAKRTLVIKTYDYTLSVAPFPSGFNPYCQESNLTVWGVISGTPFDLNSGSLPTFTGGNPVDINVAACNAAAGNSMHAVLEISSGSMRFVSRTNGFALDSVDASTAILTVTDNSTGYSTNGNIYSRAPANQRVHVWGIGDPYGLGQGNQGPDEPVFSGTQSTCDPTGQCVGGSGAVSFHVARPNTTTVPAAEYRNLIVLENQPDAAGYSLNYELIPGGIYDVRFQTVYRYQQDAQYVQSMIWQDHDNNQNVITAMGIDNFDGLGNKYFFNYGGHSGGIGDPFLYHTEVMTPGHVDTWEIQFRNIADSTGWIDLYRNGVKQFHYDGRTVTTTSYDLMSFGIYYYNWNINRSTVLYQDMTFNTFELSTIPGPVPPM